MANEVVSLAYYVSRAKRAGVPQEELKQQADFIRYIEERIDISRARALWDEMYDDPILPPNQISLSQTQFQDVVDQVFRGVDLRQVTLSVTAQPAVQLVHNPYFPQYLATLDGDTRTASSVRVSLERLDEVIAGRAATEARGNGLIVGRVQSGKTRNYIGLMLKAVDDGWNVIIVLTSAIKALAQQTRKRIVSEFQQVGADNAQFAGELDFLNPGAVNRPAGRELQGDYFYWGVSMKQADGLERIRGWFNLPNQPHASMRVLIIDDEADNATPDVMVGEKPNLTDEEIAERIQDIRRMPGCGELADWLDSLLLREWPDPNAQTPEAAVFRRIEEELKSNRSARNKRDAIVNTAEYRHFLGMDAFADPPVENLVVQCFSRVRGDNTCAAFVHLLKSILEIVRDRSAINGAICSLIGPNEDTGAYAYPFQRCAYLGYTATPYANILNEGPSHTPIYADFIQSLPVSPQYFGADAIFGHDTSNSVPRMPIVGPITDQDVSRILNPLRQDGTLEINADLVCRDSDGGTVEWQSLKEAVAWAFCTAAVRRSRRRAMADSDAKKNELDRRWTTMLVNIDHRQSVHGLVNARLDEYVTRRCETPEARAAFADFCRSVWEKQTAQFPLAKFKELFNPVGDDAFRYGDNVDGYPDWEAIRADLDYFLANRARAVHTVVFNSTGAGSEAQRLYSQDADEIQTGKVMELTSDHLWIVNGGNTIGRGLTLLGLTVSYFDRVRDGTCVDTLTQMGRWFGYRKGYELLPRIWMHSAGTNVRSAATGDEEDGAGDVDTILEMKRIAALELKLHESIAYNFDQKFSPADPSHFQQITCWGRALSSRAFAMCDLDANVGTTAATAFFHEDGEKRRRIFETCSDFLRDLGPASQRDEAEYAYATIPLWENVSRTAVRSLLDRLCTDAPEESRKILRGIVRDIDTSEPIDWDVVIGQPQDVAAANGPRATFGGQSVVCGTPTVVPQGGGVLRSSGTGLHMPFYAMIRSVFLNRTDVDRLREFREPVIRAIERQRDKGGEPWRKLNEELPGDERTDLATRLGDLIEELDRADGARTLPESVRARLRDVAPGVVVRSDAAYAADVHKAAGHRRPVLQLYPFRPAGDRPDVPPFVAISLYWPDHAPMDFFTVSVDANEAYARTVSTGTFYRNVEEVLRERDFPMQRMELQRVVLGRLFPRCSAAFFSQHVAQPLPGYAYHKMAGREAYCIDGWAEDEERKLDLAFLRAAIDVLRRDRRPYETGELIGQVVLEQPKFGGFFRPTRDNSRLNGLMTDEVLDQNDIAVVSRRPIQYAYQP